MRIIIGSCFQQDIANNKATAITCTLRSFPKPNPIDPNTASYYGEGDFAAFADFPTKLDSSAMTFVDQVT